MSEEPGGESDQGEQSESERSTTPGPVKEARGGGGLGLPPEYTMPCCRGPVYVPILSRPVI